MFSMGRNRESTSTFFTRLASRFDGKRSSNPPSVSLASPASQTSLSTTYCVTPLHRMLIYLILFLQFSNSRTSSSFPFSPTFPQSYSPRVTMHGSASSIVCGSTMATTSGRGFYNR